MASSNYNITHVMIKKIMNKKKVAMKKIKIIIELIMCHQSRL